MAREETRPWSSKDVQVLRDKAHLGAHVLADLLGRSPRSVQQAAHRHRISLRRAGSKRGALLGQPKGTAWLSQRGNISERTLTEIRERVLDGTLDLTAVEAQVQRMLAGQQRPLCPNCVEREQTRPNGLCDVCHLRALAEAHRNAIAHQDAFKDYELARQQKRRAKKGD